MAEVTYLEALRQGLWEEMERDPNVFILGEDVGAYGGAFTIRLWQQWTQGAWHARFPSRWRGGAWRI